MSDDLTWLHISDLHACKPRTGWDAKRVTETLRADLQKMRERHSLHPDLIFFTGDSAFGQIGKQRGKAIADQFREAHDFLTAIREVYDPPIPQRNLFLVPGNHDVNRDRITRFESRWLEELDSVDEIQLCAQEAGVDWQRLLARLTDYEAFLKTCGYDHLLTGREHLIYADAREFPGVRVGVAGFNSAWSSRGAGREEAGRLWMAGRFQLETLLGKMPPHDLAIALVHHPANWLVPEENPGFGRQLERDFPFVLHGHEHQDFVRPDATTGHTVISAGACHEWSEGKNNGYNFVRLDLAAGTGEVWLREYESTGGGWRPRVITGRTDELGRWALYHLDPWMARLVLSRSAARQTPADSTTTAVIAAEDSFEEISDHSADRSADYETRYRKAVANRLDFVQIFGIEVPREAKEYSLTVAYVSLNLADEDEDELSPESDDEPEAEGPTSLAAEEVFDSLCPERGRLLIRGAAGCGKTTLMRWAAVQAGRVGNAGFEDTREQLLADRAREPSTPDTDNWRRKVPFMIRLRDCPGGQLPRPADFPLLLAKELPDPPVGWVDDVLRSGRGLIMFDGADEVPPKARAEVLREIRQLMRTHPDNYYVVTTRPEAVERVEFRELGFVSARVEPMAPHDRDTFIDRWHEAMEVRLRNWNEPADLRPLAKRLKRRLEETPAIARLTVNPLLCAVVCALHRERNENLPETPVELCEKLCEMLLLRRDQERPGPETQVFIDTAYRRLEFRVRKGLLSKLAHHMVLEGVSAIDEAEADQQIEKALRSYNLSDVEPVAVRRALVERSGMLQESSEERIEFLHNTLKEFLAAERFVNSGDFQTMADNATEASWQPVILFAVALPRDGSSFATDLVKAILEKTPLDAPSPGRSKKSRRQAAKKRERQFFFFRACSNAYQLDDGSLIDAYEQISEHLLPPRNMTDAEGLATCGETVVRYLERRTGLKARQRAACVRALRLIGGSRARKCIEAYFDESAFLVLRELGKLTSALEVPTALSHVVRSGYLPGWISTQNLDLSPLASLPELTSLTLDSSHINNFGPLASLTRLTSLRLFGKGISELDALASLTKLTSLNLEKTQVIDLGPLASLTNLTSLNLDNTRVSDLGPLASLTKLTSPNLDKTRISDLGPLASLMNLTNLNLDNTRVSDLGPLASLMNLTGLNLSRTRVGELSTLAPLTNLTSLKLHNTRISNVDPLASLTKLTELYLAGTRVSDLGPLASLTNLTGLYLSGARVSDLGPLASLTNLTSLNLDKTRSSNLGPLVALTNLTSLSLRNTQVSDLGPLASLKNLTSLRLSNTQVSDLGPLASLTKLTVLSLSGTVASDLRPLVSLTKLKHLYIGSPRTAISTSSLTMLKFALPNCRIAVLRRRFPQIARAERPTSPKPPC